MLAALLLAVLTPVAMAEVPSTHGKPFAETFLLLQLSDGEAEKQQRVLSVAANMIEHYGPDGIAIEVVAFGPGVRLLYQNSDNVEEVNSLVAQGVRFVVCMNTIKTIVRNTGATPKLNPNVERVDVGVAYMLEKVQEGYTLIRP